MTEYAMEPVMLEDTMDVAPSTHGHMMNPDDIEIDFDDYQDRIAEDDNDVVVDDASVTASNHPDMPEDIYEGTNDADMIDEEYKEGEGHIPEVEYAQYLETHNQNDVGAPYTEQGAYEEEMEEDYEEDIDAPIREDNNDQVAPVSDETRATQTAPATEERPKTENDQQEMSHHRLDTSEQHVFPSENQAHDDIVPSQQPLDHAVETKETEELPHKAEPENSEQEQTHPPLESEQNTSVEEFHQQDTHSAITPTQNDNNTNINYQTEDGGEAGLKPDYEATIDATQGTGNVEQEEDRSGKVAEEDNQTYQAAAPGHTDEIVKQREEEYVPEVSQSQEAYTELHRITILYQADEISLFPPKEGDSSEMFFLEDEGVAHEPIGQLFQAFRSVLGSDVTEDEELIADIDSLNIQISESMTKYSSVTLFQLLQVYLQLSHNDGAAEPDILYITLGSRPTLDAEFSTLSTAAQEGKGISQLGEWTEYEQYESGDAAVLREQEGHGSPAHEDEQVQVEQLNDDQPQPSPKSPLLRPQSPTLHNSESGFEQTEPQAPASPSDRAPDRAHELEHVPDHAGSPRAEDREPGEITNEEESSEPTIQGDVDEGYSHVGVYDSIDTAEEPGELYEQSADYKTEDYQTEHFGDEHDAFAVEDPNGPVANATLEQAVPDHESHLSAPPQSPKPDSAPPAEVSATGGVSENFNARDEEHIEIDLGTDDTIPEAKDGVVNNTVSAADGDDGSLEVVSEGDPSRSQGQNDNQHLLASDAEQVNRPNTPEPRDILDIDEDLFKSPMVDQGANLGLGGDPSIEPFETGEFAPAEPSYEAAPETEVYNLDNLVDNGNTGADPAHYPLAADHEKLEIQEQEDGSPKPSKRPRPEDEPNDPTSPLPDLKRHRSE